MSNITPVNEKTLKVCETFSSIQGEGLAAGRPCFFVRLSGCNLRCRWCDTSYAWSGGNFLEFEELTELWRLSGIRLVQITGGEPLVQKNTLLFIQRLMGQGAEILLETNGSIDLSPVPGGVVKIVDRKTPSSGMVGMWRDGNVQHLREGDQVKFVIGSRYDYLWSCEEIKRLNLRSAVTVIFSPVAGQLSPAEMASWIMEDRLDVRLQLQLHKVIWGDRRGV